MVTVLEVLVCVRRLWVIVTSSTPLKVYLFDGGVVIFGSVLKQRSAVDLPADDEVSFISACHGKANHAARVEPFLSCSWHTCCLLTTQPCCSIRCCQGSAHVRLTGTILKSAKRRKRPQLCWRSST